MNILLPLLLQLIPVFLGLLLFYLIYQRLDSMSRSLSALASAPLLSGPPAAEQPTDRTALRLQALERFTLMLERLSIPNLLLRHPPEIGKPSREYMAELLLSIRQELEYNVTQQIYVSDSLWSIIRQARDNVGVLISRAAEGTETSQEIANRLRALSSRQEEDAVALAQGAIRREASGLVGS